MALRASANTAHTTLAEAEDVVGVIEMPFHLAGIELSQVQAHVEHPAVGLAGTASACLELDELQRVRAVAAKMLALEEIVGTLSSG